VEIWDMLAALRDEKRGSSEALDTYQVRMWDGRTRSFSDRPFDRPRAVAFAARRLLILMKLAGYGAASVVPIPSTSHVTPGKPFLGEAIARAIEQRDPRFACRPVLSFATPLPRTSQGGRRTATAVRVNLRSGNLTGLGRVVLLDDIMTTGAHMRGAATFLRDKGVRVEDGFVVARPADAPPEDMMKAPVVELRL
jgi:phosphoribosylpyrophosphate synthetase